MPPPDSTTLLARLERMPGELRAAAARLGERHALDAPPGGGFSLVEQAWHLADLEREGFGARITRLLEEEAPFLPDFDGARIARERDYRSRPLDAGLQAFAAARAANLARLRSVPEAAWHRTGTQEGVGPVTLADLPRLMLEHDDSHRKELAALLQ